MLIYIVILEIGDVFSDESSTFSAGKHVCDHQEFNGFSIALHNNMCVLMYGQ